MTYTDWEVTDLNGDGYPDVIFNSSPVLFNTVVQPDPDPPDNPNATNLYATRSTTTTPSLPASNEIDAMLNVVGVHVGTDTQPFSASTTVLSNDSCGVSRWTAVDGAHQEITCGIADVKGDGIADRVQNQSARLGTGVFGASGFFTPGAMLSLPGALATQKNEQATKCLPPATGATTFTTTQTAGLRDLTGDGIPDYVTADGAGNGTVRIGTGTGFLPAIPINGMFVALSSQLEDCAGTTSTTQTGLYDIDGDGKPDVIGSDNSVYQLIGNGAVGAPEAGRLVTIDNGFGAITTITYGPAKQLASSSALDARHQVPFPEVVVRKVETTVPQHQ